MNDGVWSASEPQSRAISLDDAVVYDVETLATCFTLNVQGLYTDLNATFEISHFRDDRHLLFQWFSFWQANQTVMVGFNNVFFDYAVIHELYNNQFMSVEEIYAHAQMLIKNGYQNRFAGMIWDRDRFAPQLDLYLVHHFDNKAKTQSLKGLEFSMRSENVMDMPIAHDQPVAKEDIDRLVIPYNRHDVEQTKKFALMSMEAIKFRIDMMDTLGAQCINFNDTKIGAKLLEQRLGEDICYTREGGQRTRRQTPRSSIPLKDIIFPYVEFRNPEFKRILDWMRLQTLTADELTENIQTKGVFTGIHATVGGIEFHFGTGGIHGSVSAQRLASDADYVIQDIDVASLYPNIAIVNGLHPEHLGQRFVEEYAKLPKERKEWQAKKGKKCVEANSMKLASNGVYGNSNSKFSVFYDPKFTMTITVNGQLLLAMLVEWLLDVSTLQLVQVNTDGITYQIHRSQVEYARIIRRMWERLTKLVLEEAEYSRMWIRDVNSYIAEGFDGSLKMKGAFWYPVNFPDDISNAQPPAWHKDFSAQIVIMAAVAHMTKGEDIERFIYSHRDPFDFMCRAKCDRSSKLMIGDEEVQRITRYYVALNGGFMRKISPPAGPEGEYKRKNGISDFDYHTIKSQIAPGTHDERIHTKNKSRYETRETSVESGYKVAECNVASRFDFGNLNYDYYIEAAKKLVIA